MEVAGQSRIDDSAPQRRLRIGRQKKQAAQSHNCFFAPSSVRPSVCRSLADLLMDSVHANLLDDTTNVSGNAGTEMPSY